MFAPIAYSHSQVGSSDLIITAGVCLLLGFIALVIGRIDVSEPDPEPDPDSPFQFGLTVRTPQQRTASVAILVLVILGVLGFGVVFSRMTVSIRDATLSWSFALGFDQHHVPVSEIATASVMQNSVNEGLGIHETSTGTLYNISGDESVHVQLRDGSEFRLGTDQPDALLNAIRASMR